MGDVELAAGERVLVRTRLHPVVLTGAVTLAAFVLLATGLIIRNNDLAAATNVRVAIGGGLLAIAAALPGVLRWRASAFVVTDRRLLARTGWLSVRRLDVPLGKAAAVEAQVPFFGRLLGYGTLHVTTPEGTTVSFAHVEDAPTVQAIVARAGRGR